MKELVMVVVGSIITRFIEANFNMKVSNWKLNEIINGHKKIHIIIACGLFFAYPIMILSYSTMVYYSHTFKYWENLVYVLFLFFFLILLLVCIYLASKGFIDTIKFLWEVITYRQSL